MYLSFERIAVSDTVLTVSDLTVPGNATMVEIQSDTQDVRYTMDDSTDPAQASGMVFGTAHVPKLFVIDDIRRMKFVRGNASNGAINIHYLSGRDV